MTTSRVLPLQFDAGWVHTNSLLGPEHCCEFHKLTMVWMSLNAAMVMCYGPLLEAAKTNVNVKSFWRDTAPLICKHPDDFASVRRLSGFACNMFLWLLFCAKYSKSHGRFTVAQRYTIVKENDVMNTFRIESEGGGHCGCVRLQRRKPKATRTLRFISYHKYIGSAHS